MLTKTEICTLFGCTREQLQQQYAANARTLSTMAAQAKKTGKSVNHYTADELEAATKQYKNLSLKFGVGDRVAYVIGNVTHFTGTITGAKKSRGKKPYSIYTDDGEMKFANERFLKAI